MGSKLIILVEDDINLRQSIALILQRAGYQVTATDCVSEALDLIHAGRFQLIISDLNIPETQQVLIPKIQGSYPKMSIVILTDQSVYGHDKADGLSSAHYLIKPLAPERLLDCVDGLLAHANDESYPNDCCPSGEPSLPFKAI